MSLPKDDGASLAAGETARSASDSEAAIARHTPGPWECQNHLGNNNWYRVWPVFKRTNFGKLPVCEGGGYYLKNSADAHLIAAAPELKEALKALLDSMVFTCDCGTREEFFDKARAALAKAEGR